MFTEVIEVGATDDTFIGPTVAIAFGTKPLAMLVEHVLDLLPVLGEELGGGADGEDGIHGEGDEDELSGSGFGNGGLRDEDESRAGAVGHSRGG